MALIFYLGTTGHLCMAHVGSVTYRGPSEGVTVDGPHCGPQREGFCQ